MVSKLSEAMRLSRARSAGHTLASNFLIAQGESEPTGLFLRAQAYSSDLPFRMWKAQRSEPVAPEIECQMSTGSTSMHKRDSRPRGPHGP